MTAFMTAVDRAVAAHMARGRCDERTVIAAVVKFHRGLWFTILASSDQRDRELLSKPEFLQLPASVMVRPGNLLSLLLVPAVTAP
jgi:hypothetical protein